MGGTYEVAYYLLTLAAFGAQRVLKKAVKILPFQSGILKEANPTPGTVGPDVSFITNEPNNGNLILGCHAGPVDHIDIDSLNGSATL